MLSNPTDPHVKETYKDINLEVLLKDIWAPDTYMMMFVTHEGEVRIKTSAIQTTIMEFAHEGWNSKYEWNCSNALIYGTRRSYFDPQVTDYYLGATADSYEDENIDFVVLTKAIKESEILLRNYFEQVSDRNIEA